MDLFGYGTPLRMVLLAHWNVCIFVRSKRFASSRAEEGFRDRVFYIPHRLSIHHMLAHLYLFELGLHPGVPGEPNVDGAFEVVPPARMPELIDSNTEAAGFMVAEIVDIDASNVEDAPPMLSAAEFILATAKVRGEVKLLVDIEKITQGTLDLVA
jgi:hypothetical protein